MKSFIIKIVKMNTIKGLAMRFFVLAHGALGIWDEVIFISVGVIFLIFMVVSWVRSRNISPVSDEKLSQDPPKSDDNTYFRLD